MHPEKMAESARGWHAIQLAVLSFIGFCGVLRMGADSSGPSWLSWMAGGSVLAAFASALGSMWMVGTVAFPVHLGQELPANAPSRLRGGIRMTFVSVALMALAGASAWWPGSGGGDSVEVTGSNGVSACGRVVDGAPEGMMWLRSDAAKQPLAIQLSAVAQMRVVSSCA